MKRWEIVSGICITVISILGACTPTPTIPQPITIPEPSVDQITAQSPVQTYSIKGTAYHDYNGDGIKEEDESIISGLEVSFFDEKAKEYRVKTDLNGFYTIQLPMGTYKLKINDSVRGYNDQPYTFFNISKEKFLPLNDSNYIIYADIKEEKEANIRLMQGFLTLPFCMNSKVEILYHYDVDRRPNVMKDFEGGSRTYDNHLGTDFLLPVGTKIVAAAPGIVFDKEWDWPNGGNGVAIKHLNGMLTIYGHLNRIDVNIGDIVKRGDQIALSGTGGLNPPHLHFQLNPGGRSASANRIDRSVLTNTINPYRDINDVKSRNYWTVDNETKCP